MSVTPEEVARLAALAELAVKPEELAALTAQLDRIVGFVEQLGELGDQEGAGRFVAGPDAAPLREDVVRPASLAIPPRDLAPEFDGGFFVVPKLGTLEGEG